ncbi:DUF262 domain-containing protein [Paraburkholderia phenoliruptrix]|uniref:GmrSD restriction endonucleases N-terminal domain-containing protein n=2 Tax=Paraburkholderia phenoliruptrix TaxID=252970 RepID=K0E308_9BURK|nr:DUF262 domain-containing protein [Paraburkholderia phenoliruptrix]AFT90159.1 hypothetical protein BUPH_05114 [Paraburkholderia phenoliruptrix BR3459a]CAB4053034.1 hypothetical protein LMG9964_06725 [Paraburkholderia phenoliruptrix]
MKSYVTSYNGLFARRAADTPIVQRIEIPIIQRDYAQGRDSDGVARIRANFLDVLQEALETGNAVNLDFVYGDVVDGTLRPLDGQQRLTTLFLLHWYLAWRADRLEQEHGWKQFAYATRPSARRFCECLVKSKPPTDVKVRTWIEDQGWFLHTWQYDPTIQSMLVMLEAIHERFVSVDCATAWNRLVAPDAPAISFHLLPIEQMGLSEDLYIKMNSRGKPLTTFENFKATFEQVLEGSCPDRLEEFARKVDGSWADLLWPYRDESDDIVDDLFMRYFQFVTDVCAWHDGRLASGNLTSLAESVYGTGNANAKIHVDFLIRCFDTWVDADINRVFSEAFSMTPSAVDSDDTRKVVLFGLPSTATSNLFSACCLGQMRFSWPRMLFLYAVVLHRLEGTTDFARRLRVVRNLIEASSSELRADSMPTLLADVRALIVDGKLDDFSAFNQAQVSDERIKAAMLERAPSLTRHLFHLEDHPLLRGCLAAFELDEAVFERRAKAFHEIFVNENFPFLTAALLAAGDYSRSRSRRFFQFGSSTNSSQWRELLTGASRAHLSETRKVLGRLLDAIAEYEGDGRSALESLTSGWLTRTGDAEGLDWRWYFVKYPVMRTGNSGIYVGLNGALGYSVCMLDKSQMNSWYRDPYLSAIQHASGTPSAVEEPWFTGYETEPRRMRLKSSGTEIQCVPEGLQLRAPADPPKAEVFARVCTDLAIGSDLLLRVPKVVNAGGDQLDTQDRIRLGADLMRALVDAGL